MEKANFKQIDLLRKRRESENVIDPFFVDSKKFIKKGTSIGIGLVIFSFLLGIPFIVRINLLEKAKLKIVEFKDEYDALESKLDKESVQLKTIAKFNKELKNSIMNISSSSALLKEISIVIPKEIQLIDFVSEGNKLTLKSEIFNKDYLKTVNSFLLSLDNSKLVKFSEFDLEEIKRLNNTENQLGFAFIIKTEINNEYRDINQKYLTKLGSLGLSNRLNILKNIDNETKNK